MKQEILLTGTAKDLTQLDINKATQNFAKFEIKNNQVFITTSMPASWQKERL